MEKSSGGSAAPPDYDTVVTSSSAGNHSLGTGYIRTLPGMLKIGEAALCVVTLICAVIATTMGGGWGTFVSGVALAECIALLVLHSTGIIHRLPYNMSLWEFINAIINATVFFIASVVCATTGLPAHIAYAVFGFAACLAFVVDSVLQYRIVRSGMGFTLRRTATGSQEPQEPARY